MVAPVDSREKYLWFLLVSVATAFSFANGSDNRNFLLIGFMYVVPVLLITQCAILQKSDLLVYALFSSMVLCALRHPASFRISTLIYSLMFMVLFLYAMRLTYASVLRIDRYMLLLRWIIGAYCITLMVQQILLLSGSAYIFNQIQSVTEEFKLNALSPEPSHSSRILLFLMLSYVSMREVVNNRAYDLSMDWRKDKMLWLLFLYPMLTMGSGAAFFFLPLFLVKFMKFKNILRIVPIVLVAVLVVSQTQFKPVQRVVAFSQAVVTLDEKVILRTDHSASFRIVPSLLYVKMFSLSNPDVWMGYGIDFEKKLFPRIIPGLPANKGVGGIFPTFIMNYGLIPTFFLFLLIRHFCWVKVFSYDALMWLLMIGPVPLNTQLAWLSLILMGINKYFMKHPQVAIQQGSGPLRLPLREQ